MLRSNPGQLRLRHWLSDALTTRIDLIHFSARSLIHITIYNVNYCSYYCAIGLNKIKKLLSSPPPARFIWHLRKCSRENKKWASINKNTGGHPWFMAPRNIWQNLFDISKTGSLLRYQSKGRKEYKPFYILQYIHTNIRCCTEAEFLDVIGTKVLRSFPPCYSQSPLLTDFTYLLVDLRNSNTKLTDVNQRFGRLPGCFAQANGGADLKSNKPKLRDIKIGIRNWKHGSMISELKAK